MKKLVTDGDGAVRVYNCSVRLGGSLLHSVPKIRISGEEVRLLKTIHGDDSIIELKELGALSGWTRMEELNDLADRYSTETGKGDGIKLVEKTFGVTLAGFEDWVDQKQQAAEDRAAEDEALRRLEQSASAKGTLVRSTATT